MQEVHGFKLHYLEGRVLDRATLVPPAEVFFARLLWQCVSCCCCLQGVQLEEDYSPCVVQLHAKPTSLSQLVFNISVCWSQLMLLLSAGCAAGRSVQPECTAVGAG